MIVRISGEDQYELGEDDRARLHELDVEVQEAIEADDEEGFSGRFATLLDFIRTQGKALPDDFLEGSDVILPPADLTLEEARDEFSTEGLIPD